jgi:hypothetical protein
MVIVVYGNYGIISSVSLAIPCGSSEAFRTSLQLSNAGEKNVKVTLFEPNLRGGEGIALDFKFEHSSEKVFFRKGLS